MIGKNHQGILVTLTERKSRYALAGKLLSKHAASVTAKVKQPAAPTPQTGVKLLRIPHVAHGDQAQ